jgi:hypothetical protein
MANTWQPQHNIFLLKDRYMSGEYQKIPHPEEHSDRPRNIEHSEPHLFAAIMARDVQTDADHHQSDASRQSDHQYTSFDKFEPTYNLHNYGGTATVEGFIGIVREGKPIVDTSPKAGATLESGTVIFANGAQWELKDGLQAVVKPGGKVELSQQGSFPLSEDQQLTRMRLESLHALGIEPGSLSVVRNDGGGPKLATAMEWTPFVASNGRIDHRDFAPMNVAFMQAMQRGEAYTFTNSLGLQVTMNPREPWGAFEPIIQNTGHEIYGAEHTAAFNNTQARTLPILRIEQGGILDDWTQGQHPEGRVARLADFVVDSITDNPHEAEQMFKDVIQTLQPGDVFSFHGMQNDAASEGGEGAGYPAGANTNFPNVAWSRADYQRIFDQINTERLERGETGINFLIKSTGDEAGTAREGYHGMLNITGMVEQRNVTA